MNSINKTINLALFVATALVASNNVHAQTLSLDQCLDNAKANNKAIKISENELRLTEEKQREVKANLLPKITANGDYKYYAELPTQLMPLSVFGGPEGKYKEAQFGVPHNLNGNIQLTMPLYKPELYGGIEASKIAGEVSKLKIEKTEEQIYFDIANYYYNAQIIKSQIKFLDANLANSKKLLKNVTLLHEQLLLQQIDVDKVALQVKQIESKTNILNNKHEQVINGLKLMIGLDLEQSLDVEDEIVKNESIDYTTKSSLDFRMVETKNTLLQSQLKTLKKTRYLPSAYLYGSYGTLGYGYTETPNEFLNFYTMGFVGVKVSYPIFNGTVTNKKINQKNIEIENNELQRSLLTDQNTTQVKNARLSKLVAQETINESNLQIELAQKIYNTTLLQQKQDLANLTDVLMADNALRQSQQDYINAVIDYLKADLEIKKLTGNIK